MTCEKF